MRKVLFLVLTIFFSCASYSQKITSEEYEIYGTLIGSQGYQFYPISLGIPTEFKIEFEDSVNTKIENLKIKTIDQKKLIAVSLKYSVNKTFRILQQNLHNKIYISPIYFKTKDTAYFIYVIKSELPKPYFYFYEARKINNKWVFTDYYIIT